MAEQPIKKDNAPDNNVSEAQIQEVITLEKFLASASPEVKAKLETVGEVMRKARVTHLVITVSESGL